MSVLGKRFLIILFVFFLCQGAIIRSTLAQLEASLANFENTIGEGFKKSFGFLEPTNTQDQSSTQSTASSDLQNQFTDQPSPPTSEDFIKFPSQQNTQPTIAVAPSLEDAPIEITVTINRTIQIKEQLNVTTIGEDSENLISNPTKQFQQKQYIFRGNSGNLRSAIKQNLNKGTTVHPDKQVSQVKEISNLNLNNQNPQTTQLKNQSPSTHSDTANTQPITITSSANPSNPSPVPQPTFSQDINAIWAHFNKKDVPEPEPKIVVAPGLSQSDLKLYNKVQDQIKASDIAQEVFYRTKNNPDPKIQI